MNENLPPKSGWINDDRCKYCLASELPPALKGKAILTRSSVWPCFSSIVSIDWPRFSSAVFAIVVSPGNSYLTAINWTLVAYKGYALPLSYSPSPKTEKCQSLA